MLDGNSYLSKEQYNNCFNNISRDTKYIIIPQLRLSELNLNNEDILNNNKLLNQLSGFEPQIIFSRDSKYRFNSLIPYGASPKAELLRVLNVRGQWNSWNDNYIYYGIKDRIKTTELHSYCSSVYRLNSFSETNNITSNYTNRQIGLWYLIEKCRKLE